MKSTAWLPLILGLVMSCANTGTLAGESRSGPEATSTTPAPSTAPASEVRPAIVSGGRGHSTVEVLDPVTLQPIFAPIDIAGYLSAEHAVLPSGRLVLFSWEGVDWSDGRVSLLDPVTGRVETVEGRYSSGMRVIGYSSDLARVVVDDEVDRDEPRIHLLDPVSLTSTDRLLDLGDATDWWPEQAALFDEGRKIAFYTPMGYDEDRIGEPPAVRVLDLASNELGPPYPLEGVIHGYVELPPEGVRQPEWPYGEVTPGVAFDRVDGRLFTAHADGESITVMDLSTGSVEVQRLFDRPSFWGQALSWLIPVANAKGSEPSGLVTAWIGPDRSRLLVTGSASDAWRETDGRLHTTTRPLGLTVIATATLEVLASLDLPVSGGISTRNGIGLTGHTSDLLWCDQVCNPANNEPDVEGEAIDSGLYILDPSSLEVRFHHRPGANFYTLAGTGNHVVAETYDDGIGYYEAIDLASGSTTGRHVIDRNTFLLPAETALLLVRHQD